MSSSISISPELSAEMPSSASEQHIPQDGYPAISAFAILTPRTVAPTVAKATFIPGRTFGAPQTQSTTSLPVSIFNRCSLFEFGCASTDAIFATMTPLTSAPISITSSTSAVERVKRRIRARRSSPERSTKSPIQFIESSMAFFLPYSLTNCDSAESEPPLKSRMSLTPNFIIASRVSPSPNANPV